MISIAISFLYIHFEQIQLPWVKQRVSDSLSNIYFFQKSGLVYAKIDNLSIFFFCKFSFSFSKKYSPKILTSIYRIIFCQPYPTIDVYLVWHTSKIHKIYAIRICVFWRCRMHLLHDWFCDYKANLNFQRISLFAPCAYLWSCICNLSLGVRI